MDEETEREIVTNALDSVLVDVTLYAERHYGQQPLTDETMGKVRAALRLLAKEK